MTRIAPESSPDGEAEYDVAASGISAKIGHLSHIDKSEIRSGIYDYIRTVSHDKRCRA